MRGWFGGFRSGQGLEEFERVLGGLVLIGVSVGLSRRVYEHPGFGFWGVWVCMGSEGPGVLDVGLI